MKRHIYALIRADGSAAEQVYAEGRKRPVWADDNDPSAHRVVRLSRLMEPWERHTGRRIVADHDHRRAMIDVEHAADHGPFALPIEHMRKAIEARLIMAGVALDGLVTREAALRGITAQALAAIIVEKDDAACDRLLARQGQKLSVGK